MKKKHKKLFTINTVYTVEDAVRNINTSSGKISYNWLDLANYWWGGYLRLTLSGNIDQSTIDSDINTWAVGHTVHINASLWKLINALGFSVDTDSKFTFLAMTNYLKSTLKSGTVIESPIVLIGGKFKKGQDPATLNISSGGTAEVKGQIIEAIDHSTILIVNITKSSTFKIDRAHLVIGTFNISTGGVYIFGGVAPDINTVLNFTKTDGGTESYTVTDDEVTYNNGSGGKTHYEQKFYTSTLNLDQGAVETLNDGVIFFDYDNTINVTGDIKLSGNYIVGWNNNALVFSASFEIDDNSYLVISGKVDLGGYGFTGNGTLIVMGEYYDAANKTFKLSTFNVTNGGQLGTVYLGYDPQYDNGLGGYDHTLSDSNLVNPDPQYGISSTFSGSIALNGTVYLGGGTDSNKTVQNGILTLANDTIISDGTASDGLVITTDGILTAGGNVTLGLLNLKGGQITLTSGDQFTTFNASSGNLTATGDIKGADLNINGNATLIFKNNLTLTGNISINAGTLTVNGTFSDQNNTISVTGSGNINLADAGNLTEIDISTSGTNTLGGNIVKLVLEQGNQGTTTLTGTSFGNIEANDGSLTVNNDETGNNLIVAGANATFNNLTINNTISITAGHLIVKGTLKDKDGLLSVTGSGSIDIGNVDQLSEIDINTSGSNTLGGNVVKLVLEQGNSGQTTLTGTNFGDIEANGGDLVANSNETGDTLTINGGETTFNETLTVGNTVVKAGQLTVQTLNYTGSNPFFVQGSGSVTIKGGTKIGEVNINSNGTNTFNVDITDLVLGSNNSGTTFLTLQYNSQSPVVNYETVTVNNGILTVGEQVFYDTALTLNNGQITLGQNNVCKDVTIADGQLTVNGSFTIMAAFNMSGGTAHFNGSVIGSNTFTISGGQVEIDDTLTLTTQPLLITGGGSLTLKDSSLTGEIDISSSNDNTLGGAIQTLILEQTNSGKTTLTGSTFGTITLYAGLLIPSANETGDNLTLNNITVNFATLNIKKSITLNSGKLIATIFNNNTRQTLIIGKNVSVDIVSGSLGNVSIDGSLFDNYLGGTINSLTITNSNSYLTYLRDSIITNIDLEEASDLIILNTTSLTGLLTLKTNTTLDIKGTLNYSGNSFTIQDQANLTLDGGTLTLSSGKNTEISGDFNLTCSNGGIIELDNASSLDIKNGMTVTGQLDLKGKGGSVTFNGGIIAGDYKSTITVDAGVTLILNSGCDIKPTIVLDNNATLDIEDPHNTNVIIQFNDTTVGKILIKFDMQINSDRFAIDNQLKNFSQSSELDFTQLKYSDVTISKVYYKNGKIYIDYINNNTPQNTKEIVLNNVNVDSTIYDGQVLKVIKDDNGGVLIETCFLSGSQIATPKGLTNIEHLKIGDEILTYNNNKPPQKDEIIWIGKATCRVRPYLPDDQAGYPICIRKNAIKTNTPHKDLLVTAEHCLLMDNQFIPARMLVNHRSIYYDKTFTLYEYYHIETEQHSVIMANGLLTESYLDTGNKKEFCKESSIKLSEIKPIKTWKQHAAAPLTVSSTVVEPLYQQINTRSIQMNIENCGNEKVIINDSGICLRADNQKIIHGSTVEGQWHHFTIPSNVTIIELISRTSRPCDSIGPYIDDRRWLGVLIGKIIYRDKNQNEVLDFHLKNQNLRGWNALEIDVPHCRWTKGEAILCLKKRSLNTIGVLSLQVLSAGPYVIENTTEEHSNTLKLA